jgi:uncharacterized membrane protein
LHSGKGQLISIGGALFLTAFTIPFLLGEIMGFTFLVTFTSISLAIFLLAAAALHILFIYLLKAPTIAGRLMLDRVQGFNFKMFLGKVEGDRLNRTAPPQQTPEVFEKYLPYALALDVEQDWAEQFSGILGAAGTAPGSGVSPAYVPSFYSGSSWNGFSGTNFASSLSSSFTSAISSSSAAPGSSSGSGGGGGGSGGGGGGGGGGGW